MNMILCPERLPMRGSQSAIHVHSRDARPGTRQGRAIGAVTIVAAGFLLGCGEAEYQPPEQDRVFFMAQAALAEGNREKALELYSQSLATHPTPYGYMARAKVQLDLGDEGAATKDCESGLQLDPEDGDLLWLRGEIKKPAAQRFQGANALPPSAKK